MPRTFDVEITVTEEIACLNVGEKFTVEIEMPTVEKKPRGQLAGLSLEEMTDEQLKREIINANSVLYKAIQRGAADETVAANQARVDAAKAEKEKREGTKVKATATPKADAEFASAVPADEAGEEGTDGTDANEASGEDDSASYNEDTASEI